MINNSSTTISIAIGFIFFLVILKVFKYLHITVRQKKNQVLITKFSKENDSLFYYVEANWIKLSHAESIFHNPKDNVKFIELDGGGELVFDKVSKELVEDEKFLGTYNFVPPVPYEQKNANKMKYVIRKTGHYILDVFPYLIWGNGKSIKMRKGK